MTDPWWLPYLSVPCCGTPPGLAADRSDETGIPACVLCETCGARYPIEDGIIRFNATSGYADSFGFQWQEFAETQIDSVNGTTISRDFLTEIAGGTLDVLEGSVTYDAGCGAGRYSTVAAAAGAFVIAVDLSLGALRAARRNLGGYPNVILVHADARRSPIQPGAVDVALSVGVYQHTPDPLEYVRRLAETVRPGGSILFWGYERRWQSFVHPRFALRPVTRRVDAKRTLRVIERSAPALLRISDALRRLPGGRMWSRAVPIANYRGILPLDDRQRREWAVLDTLDWLAPRYDRPVTYARIESELERRGFRLTRTFADCVAFVALRVTSSQADSDMSAHRAAGRPS